MKKTFGFLCLNLVIATFALFSDAKLQAWCANGHIIMAQIAYQNLHLDVKEQVDDLVKSLGKFLPGHCSFIEAATWADDIRVKEGLRFFELWHFTNLPYDPDGILTREELELINTQSKWNDVVWLIPKAIETINNKKASTFAKALALILLIHTVADSHQPLHCCSRYSTEHPFPFGDAGGNLF